MLSGRRRAAQVTFVKDFPCRLCGKLRGSADQTDDGTGFGGVANVVVVDVKAFHGLHGDQVMIPVIVVGVGHLHLLAEAVTEGGGERDVAEDDGDLGVGVGARHHLGDADRVAEETESRRVLDVFDGVTAGSEHEWDDGVPEKRPVAVPGGALVVAILREDGDHFNEICEQEFAEEVSGGDHQALDVGDGGVDFAEFGAEPNQAVIGAGAVGVEESIVFRESEGIGALAGKLVTEGDDGVVIELILDLGGDFPFAGDELDHVPFHLGLGDFARGTFGAGGIGLQAFLLAADVLGVTGHGLDVAELADEAELLAEEDEAFGELFRDPDTAGLVVVFGLGPRERETVFFTPGARGRVAHDAAEELAEAEGLFLGGKILEPDAGDDAGGLRDVFPGGDIGGVLGRGLRLGLPALGEDLGARLFDGRTFEGEVDGVVALAGEFAEGGDFSDARGVSTDRSGRGWDRGGGGYSIFGGHCSPLLVVGGGVENQGEAFALGNFLEGGALLLGSKAAEDFSLDRAADADGDVGGDRFKRDFEGFPFGDAVGVDVVRGGFEHHFADDVAEAGGRADAVIDVRLDLLAAGARGEFADGATFAVFRNLGGGGDDGADLIAAIMADEDGGAGVEAGKIGGARRVVQDFESKPALDRSLGRKRERHRAIVGVNQAALEGGSAGEGLAD